MNEPANKLDWTQVEAVMGHALELPEAQRQAYLQRQPPSIRAEVESLLAACGRSGKFLGDDTGTPSSPASMPLAIGTQLGPYRIDAVIGHGGMGVVYRALDTRLNRPVAVKVLFDDVADRAARRRFQREAQMASALNHPHILAVYDVGEFEGRQYLITEFVDGRTLNDWVHEERPGWRQIVELLLGVADGLATAHSVGILHRDIKPDNILVGRNGYAKLADFGLAKLQERSTPETVDPAFGIEGTRPGMILGTIAYMSPEQAAGRPTDARSDIFSFGVVLHELLAGRRPFEGGSDLELLQTIIHGHAQPLGADVPVALRLTVEKALEKDPDDRYQSARDLVVDLRRLIRQSDAAAVSETSRPPTRPVRKAHVWKTATLVVLILVTIGLIGAMRLLRVQPPAPQEPTYTQVTNFTDSVVSPALSPDGRMLAFIRGDTWFQSRDQIYVKLLPNGEPVQITRDPRAKYGLAFSPDGSRIAYTVSEDAGWNTYTVSPLGGEPSLLLSNAAGLTWLDESRILFSEIRTGAHMGVVTSRENRSEYRRVYFPQDERGMAHLSYASPDRKWVLVVEMDPVWQPCRVVPMDGSSSGRQVGPRGKCTAAAWSPDGNWMYFGVEVHGANHLWRQRFPRGEPEQLTSGLTEEEGVAVAPDGGSLITSIGMRQTAVWIRDARGERAISSQGYVPTGEQSGLFGNRPKFSRDGKVLFYMRRDSPRAAIELWRTDLESGNSENVAPGFSMLEYDISSDGREIVFSTQPVGKAYQLWLATLDRRSPPQLIASSGENSPHFGPDGDILYRLSDGTSHYLSRMKRDGSERSKVATYPIGNVQTISPDRRWVVSIMRSPEGRDGGSMAVPVDGGPPRRICKGGCPVFWSADGKFLYISMQRESRTTTGKTVAIPIPEGEMFPNLPASGIQGLDHAAGFPGARVIDRWGVLPGPDPSVFAYVKMTVHRNLFRIALVR
ncbi:MAG TPA: protein kinase [Bryobacteraceae bacterium]|nr:protein kinase [Bryobacteraceae bacterium]